MASCAVAYKARQKQARFMHWKVLLAIGVNAVVHWLRDNLGIIKTSEESEKLAKEAGTSYGCYFIPAFSGLYAPYWEPTAREDHHGLTQFTNKSHIALPH